MIAATGIDAVGACGGGGRAAGGGTDGVGGFDGGGVAALGGGAAAFGGGGGEGAADAGGGGADLAAAVGAAPPVAPMSMVHNFCPGLTVSPSFTKSSFMTPAPGDGTGTEVCEQTRLRYSIVNISKARNHTNPLHSKFPSKLVTINISKLLKTILKIIFYNCSYFLYNREETKH